MLPHFSITADKDESSNKCENKESINSVDFSTDGLAISYNLSKIQLSVNSHMLIVMDLQIKKLTRIFGNLRLYVAARDQEMMPLSMVQNHYVSMCSMIHVEGCLLRVLILLFELLLIMIRCTAKFLAVQHLDYCLALSVAYIISNWFCFY